MKDATKKLLYADDMALVANGKQELQDSPTWRSGTGGLPGTG